jgi:hypothetical protein
MGNNNMIMNSDMGRMRRTSIVAYFEAASQLFSKIIVLSTDGLH